MKYKEIKGSHILTGGAMSNNDIFVSDGIFVLTEEQEKKLDEAKKYIGII